MEMIQPRMQHHSLCGCCPNGWRPPRCDRNPFWRWVAAVGGPCADQSSWSGGDEGGGAESWRGPVTVPPSDPHGWTFPLPHSPRGSLQWRRCRRRRQLLQTGASGAGWGWSAASVHGNGACCSPAVCGPAEVFSRWTAWSSPSSGLAGSPRPAGAE